MKTIILTGGGTGGHVFPNVSLLPELKKHFSKIYYLGTNGIEKEIISKYKEVKFIEINAYKFNRTHKLKNLFLPFKVLSSVTKISKIIKKIKPDIVFSKGGFVSVPVCISAKLNKIPIVSHESDLSLGKANKLIYKLSTTLCTTFEKTAQNLKKAVYTGAPIRKELNFGSVKKGKEIIDFKNNLPTIMVTGGSTGAKKLNEAIFSALPILTEKYNVIHLVGKNKGKKINCKNYFQLEFTNEIQNLFALATVVVSRAGSGAIYELLHLKKPMLLVPLPKGNSRGDQEENAKYFKEKNYAEVLEEKDLTTKTLIQKIDFLYQNKEKYLTLIQSEDTSSGSKKIVEQILLALKK